jgi:hypothetical protein
MKGILSVLAFGLWVTISAQMTDSTALDSDWVNIKGGIERPLCAQKSPNNGGWQPGSKHIYMGDTVKCSLWVCRKAASGVSNAPLMHGALYIKTQKSDSVVVDSMAGKPKKGATILGGCNLYFREIRDTGCVRR